MTVERENLGAVEHAARGLPARIVGLHPLAQASHRIAEFRDGRSSLKARDLVGLLLSHGARAYRASQPASLTRIRVRNPENRLAVRMRLI